MCRERRSSTPRRTSTRCITASSRSASTRRHPEGLKIVERLIGMCDALVENFSAEVLPNWGLTWERIHQLNPRLVYMSSSGFGHTGEWKGYRSFGPTAAAQSGLSLASGLPGQAAGGLGLLLSRRDGRVDGRPRADPGPAARRRRPARVSTSTIR